MVASFAGALVALNSLAAEPPHRVPLGPLFDPRSFRIEPKAVTRADEPKAEETPAPKPGERLQADVHTWAGGRFPLKGVVFGADLSVRGAAAEKRVSFRGDELRLVRFREPVRRGRMEFVHLHTGEVIAGTIKRIGDDRVTIDTTFFDTITIPVDRVKGVLIDLNLTEARSAAALAKLAGLAVSADALLLANGDTLTGVISSYDSGEGLKVDLKEGGSRTFSRDVVIGAVFDAGLASAPPKLPPATLVFTDGSRLAASRIESAVDRLSIDLPAVGSASVSPEDLAEIRYLSDKVVSLVDRPRVAESHVGWFGGVQAARLNASPLGGPARVDGRPVGSAIGMLPRGELSWDVAGFDRFETTFALDDSAGSQASVRYRVLLDGKPALDGGEFTRASKPKEIALSLAGARRLTLVVDFENRGDADDFALWIDPRIIKP
jgi:hypothetical protein